MLSKKFLILLYTTIIAEVGPSGHHWPRGHILKSLALASEPTSPQKFPVIGPRTALFLDWLKKK